MTIRNGIAALVGAGLAGMVLLTVHAADELNRNSAPASPDKVSVFKTTPQGELKLHFYFPKGWSPRDKRPAIIFWHGGVFAFGSPTQFYAKAEYFASRGLVCASAEYRVKNTHGTLVDKCAEDARSAMRWIKGHATEIGIDPEKVIASGGSAGGTLALLVAREKGPDAKDDDARISPRPCATILFNPAIGEIELGIIGRGGEAQALVNAQIAALNTPEKNEPPAIFFFGTEDRQFLEVSREFCRKAEAQGSRGELWTAEKMSHGFFNRPPWHEATLRKADEFLASLGYLKGPPEIKASPAAVLRRELPAGHP
ncbi:MAG: alpha/beta hydrolase [Verrucomicrobia bacterium]|nr:alpha/beta hydrolase [Verrucomicrobiota bacterium]